MTTQDLIRRYNIRLFNDRLMVDLAGCSNREQIKNEISAKKPEIVSFLQKEAIDKDNHQKHIADEYQKKLSAIEGLSELKEAFQERIDYKNKLNEAFENEFGMPPALIKKPDADISALQAKYPKADAFLKAQEWERSQNHRKSALGTEAANAILNGQDYQKTILDMNKQWKEYVNEKVFD